MVKVRATSFVKKDTRAVCSRKKGLAVVKATATSLETMTNAVSVRSLQGLAVVEKTVTSRDKRVVAGSSPASRAIQRL